MILQPKIAVMEGALDMHITKDGHVYKIVNRKVGGGEFVVCRLKVVVCAFCVSHAI